MNGARKQRLMAVASAGGHWDQMMHLRPAFAATDACFVTTMQGLADRAGITAHVVPDCNRNEPVRAVLSALAILWLVVRRRPDVIISTGALPGLIALMIGRRLGAKTIWVDSVANAEEISLAGQKARRHADVWLSQWPQVAAASGAHYWGSVL